MQIHIKFISLVLAFKAVNNSAHTFLPTSPLAVFANLVSQLLLFCLSHTGLRAGIPPCPRAFNICDVCVYIYIYYILLYCIYLCIIVCIYKMWSPFQLFLKTDILPQRQKLHCSLHFLCDTRIYPWMRTFCVCFVTLEKGLHLYFLNYHICLKCHVYDKV